MHNSIGFYRFIFTAFILLVIAPAANAQWFSFQSTYGHYLQAHTDGEMHCSNDQRGTEETWVIVKADEKRGTYAIKNVNNGRYLTYREGNCFRAQAERVGPWEHFRFEDVGNGWIRIRSAREDFPHLLGTQQAGDDTSCKGEVKSEQGSMEWRVQHHSTPGKKGDVIKDVVKTLQTAAEIAELASKVAAAL